ncbi:MAG: hypothetical protein QM831_12585 [Kofleriaceae bacterium]
MNDASATMTGEMDGAPEAPPFIPSEEWIEAFNGQYSDALQLKLKAYAARRLQGVARDGACVDDYAARELVQDVVGDTLMGVRSWNPEAKPLRQHLEDSIASRARHRRDRAKKLVHCRVDMFDAGAERAVDRAQVEASLQVEQGDAEPSSHLFARAVLDKLRGEAVNDNQAIAFIDALGEGARTPEDIMHATGMPEKTFRKTRARIRRLAASLDQHFITPLRRA